MTRKALIAIASALLVVMSEAQSFNLDIGGITAGGAGAGTPAPTYGAAAQQPGRWNYISGIDLGPYAIVNLANNPTTITCTRTDGLGGAFGWNNSMTTGYFQALMDDAHNTAIAGVVTYRFSGMAPGSYTVFTYAWSPLSATDLTNVTVAGSTTPNPQVAGGALQATNTFTLGITHTVHNVVIGPGVDLVVTCSGVTGAGAINGFQVCGGYELSLTQAAAGFPVVVSNFRGSPGNLYANLVALTPGAFPNGPMFGLDMTVPDVLNELALGPPFFGALGPNGTATFSISGVPPGIVAYCVSVEADPVTFALIAVTAPFSYTTL